MIAKGITAEQLQAAADEIGVTLDMNPTNERGDRHRVKVNPGDWKDPETGDRKYQHRSWSSDRRVHAVCWHGFRDFFRACFRRAPDAVFTTAMDKWDGSDDFEARYRQSGLRNVGSMVQPCLACEACSCPDSGVCE